MITRNGTIVGYNVKHGLVITGFLETAPWSALALRQPSRSYAQV